MRPSRKGSRSSSGTGGPTHTAVRRAAQLLPGHGPGQLPFKVNQLRVQADTEEGGRLLVVRDVAFLWDDPNRLIDCEEMLA
ncbi:hypothetical protein ACIBL6_20255 [Streptomyces sp. NPDC050400]|uniref:VMAP-C domain-containing protein n=1 Tax=Streptomyces sp. NPDC050400 TaxID=3365610 RepID=UPI0037B3C501